MVIDISTAANGTEAMRAARTSLGMTQREAAALIGVTNHTYQLWETGKLTPKADKTERIAQALHLPLEAVPVRGPRKPYGKRPVGIVDEMRAALIEKYAPYRKRRLELGMRQEALAKKAGVTQNTIWTMECGICEPLWQNLQNIRKALGWPEERYFTVEERNEQLLRMQNISRWVLIHNREYLLEGGAELEDAYQDLTLRAILSIDRFQPVEGISLESFVITQLMYEVKTIRRHAAAKGFTGEGSRWMPFRAVVSLDDLPRDMDRVELDTVA